MLAITLQPQTAALIADVLPAAACAEGITDVAQQRMEEMICLSVAALASLTHLPVHHIAGVQVWLVMSYFTSEHMELWLLS